MSNKSWCVVLVVAGLVAFEVNCAYAAGGGAKGSRAGGGAAVACRATHGNSGPCARTQSGVLGPTLAYGNAYWGWGGRHLTTDIQVGDIQGGNISCKRPLFCPVPSGLLWLWRGCPRLEQCNPSLLDLGAEAVQPAPPVPVPSHSTASAVANRQSRITLKRTRKTASPPSDNYDSLSSARHMPLKA